MPRGIQKQWQIHNLMRIFLFVFLVSIRDPEKLNLEDSVYTFWLPRALPVSSLIFSFVEQSFYRLHLLVTISVSSMMCEGGSGGKQGDHGLWLRNSLCAEAERWIWARLSIRVLSKVILPAVASAKLLQPEPLPRWNHGPPASSSGTRLHIQRQRSQTRPNPAIVQSRQLPMEWVMGESVMAF